VPRDLVPPDVTIAQRARDRAQGGTHDPTIRSICSRSVDRPAAVVCLSAGVASAQPCLIFVHGKQTNTNTFTSYASARNYWINGSHDAVKTATKNFAASYYVVGYNGTQPWWGSQSAGEVANEIVAATNGVADGGGHACARTFANGGTFWVVGHSMAGPIMDYILGNNDPSDPNFNAVGPFDVVAQRVSLVSRSAARTADRRAPTPCAATTTSSATSSRSSSRAATRRRTGCAAPTTSRCDVRERARAQHLPHGWVRGDLRRERVSVGRGRRHRAVRVDLRVQRKRDQRLRQLERLQQQCEAGVVGLREPGRLPREPFRRARRQRLRRTQADPGGIWTCNGVPCAPNTTVQSSMTSARLISILY
jgi:hypothetical protein